MAELLLDVSHELVTPLTPLVGYLKMLRSGRLGPLTERQEQVLDAMQQASSRLERTIDNLVDLASIETGRYHVHPASFDAAAMVSACVADLHTKARARHVQVEVRSAASVKAHGDERRLRQALLNVLENAIRFSPHGGRVLIDLRSEDDHRSIAVYDQGPGMKDDWTHGLPSREGEERGAGVVLAMLVAREIVEAHGGRLTIETPPKDQPPVKELYTGTKVELSIPEHGDVT